MRYLTNGVSNTSFHHEKLHKRKIFSLNEYLILYLIKQMATPGGVTPALPQTMVAALEECGVLINNPQIMNGETVSQRITNDIFDNDFYFYMELSSSDLEDNWKTYSALTVAQG